jgi:hypothetical protein
MAKRISRAKKKKITNIVICILVVGLAFGAAFFFSLRAIQSRYEKENQTLKNQYDSVQHMVYVATSDIPAGSALTEQNIAQTAISTSMDTSLYITEDDIGKIAVVDIATGQAINSNMIGSDILSSLRECQYAMITLNGNLKVNDFVDIRIMYPNGENSSVLAKKCVKGLNLETNDIYMWLDESDIMNMSSAIVDVYLHEGTILYTTKYIEDGQSALETNYQPNTDVMTAIANDPNIVDEATQKLNANMREALEARLAILEKDDQSNKSVDLSNAIASGQQSTTDSSGDASNESSSETGGYVTDGSTDGSEPPLYVDDSDNAYTDDSNNMNQDLIGGEEDYGY